MMHPPRKARMEIERVPQGVFGERALNIGLRLPKSGLAAGGGGPMAIMSMAAKLMNCSTADLMSRNGGQGSAARAGAYILIERSGATAADVAKSLGISHGSASALIGNVRKGTYAHREAYKWCSRIRDALSAS